MVRPPPRSTLFPYPPLSRSCGTGSLCKNEDVTKYAVFCLDRKSTRLNSSHRCISYAVFCLKKKRTRLNYIKRIFTHTKLSFKQDHAVSLLVYACTWCVPLDLALLFSHHFFFFFFKKGGPPEIPPFSPPRPFPF